MKNIRKYCLLENRTANEAIESILTSRKGNERLVFIVNKKFKILGTLSEGDIMRALLRNKSLDMPVTSIMNKSFKFLLKKDLIAAKKLVKKFNITIIPIVTKSMNIKSIIRLNDIL
jgi:Mg/Co/Ni transporter MgtE